MNKKKLLVTLLTLVLVCSMLFVLVACNNNNDTPGNTTPGTGTETDQGSSEDNGSGQDPDPGYPEPTNYATLNFMDHKTATPISIKVDTDPNIIPAGFTIKDLFVRDTETKYGFKANVTDGGTYWALNYVTGTKLKNKSLYPNKLQFIGCYSDDAESTFDSNTTYEINGKNLYMTNSIDAVKLKKDAQYYFVLENDSYSLPKAPVFEKDYSKEDDYGATLSDITSFENDIYFIKAAKTGLTLNKLNNKGELVKAVNLLGNKYYFMAKPVIVDNKIICVTGGYVEAFNLDTMEKVWEYKDGLTGLVTPYEVTVDEVGKAIYVGLFKSFSENGKLVALKADGTKLFEKDVMGGFYHGKSTIVNNYLVTLNNNAGKNSLISYNKTTGAVVDERLVNDMVDNQLVKNGVLESEIVYRAEDKSVYFTISERDAENKATRTASYVIRNLIDKDNGKFGNSVEYKLDQIKSDGTPVFFGNRMYITSGGGTYSKPIGTMEVIDVTTMKLIYKTNITALTEGKPFVKVINNKGVKEAYVFFTTNSNDGALKYIVDRENATHGYMETIFTPAHTQMTMSSVEVGKDGTMYYRLDYGYINAVKVDALG